MQSRPTPKTEGSGIDGTWLFVTENAMAQRSQTGDMWPRLEGGKAGSNTWPKDGVHERPAHGDRLRQATGWIATSTN